MILGGKYLQKPRQQVWSAEYYFRLAQRNIRKQVTDYLWLYCLHIDICKMTYILSIRTSSRRPRLIMRDMFGSETSLESDLPGEKVNCVTKKRMEGIAA